MARRPGRPASTSSAPIISRVSIAQTKRMDTLPRSWKRTFTLSPAATAIASVTPPVMMKLPAGIS